MAEYPTSIRLTTADKRKLRKHASRWQLSLAGLIQMVLRQWLEKQEPPKAVEPKIEEIQNDAG
jgi:hypothetical protein